MKKKNDYEKTKKDRAEKMKENNDIYLKCSFEIFILLEKQSIVDNYLRVGNFQVDNPIVHGFTWLKRRRI